MIADAKLDSVVWVVGQEKLVMVVRNRIQKEEPQGLNLRKWKKWTHREK